MSKQQKELHEKVHVGIGGYIALVLAVLFFSGIFQDAEGPIAAFDFSNLCGAFGNLGTLTEGSGTLAENFRGTGGSGARDGFLFAITLLPPVMFALGVVKIVENYGGLRAAQNLLTPILRPLMGIPGICGLSMIASLQSTDACASMTRRLVETGDLTEKERIIYCGFQFSGGGILTNYFSSGAALFPFLVDVSISIPLLLVFIFKIFGTNLMRLYVNKVLKMP